MAEQIEVEMWIFLGVAVLAVVLWLVLKLEKNGPWMD